MKDYYFETYIRLHQKTIQGQVILVNNSLDFFIYDYFTK